MSDAISVPSRNLSRLGTFTRLAYDAHFGRLVTRLPIARYEDCVAFLVRTEDLDADGFMLAVERWFLDNPNKPKLFTLMMDIVGACKERS